MKTISRIVKYFVSLCVLTSLLIALLYAVGMAAGTPADLLELLFHTTKGWIFVGAVILLSLLYPRIGFMTARVRGDINNDHAQLAEAFRTEGFKQVDDTAGVLTFRATSALRRLSLRFDDAVTVRQQGKWVEIEGARRVVALVQFRFESYIQNEHE
ncbi:MAG: hypothetical protein RSC34_04750 [Alistipes sp.]